MKKTYIILLVVCLVNVAICIGLAGWYHLRLRDTGAELESKKDSIKQFVELVTDGDADTTALTDGTQSTDADVSKEPAKDPSDTEQTAADTSENEPADTDGDSAAVPSEPTLNFDILWDTNPEITAWLEIADTYIDYPVLQSKNNDKKYLNRAYDGSWYLGGALFTEATYNRFDFNDPVTVIYGHTMPWGILFGTLQEQYSDARSFGKNGDIKLYLPDEVRHYTVFAAVPYSKMHILHTYDFTDDYMYNRFFRGVSRIREIGANFNKAAFPEAGDRVLILSVCLSEDTARRYLVMAVLNEDLADNTAGSP